MEWKLDDANNRFGEVMDLPLKEGPQRVSRSHDAVVVISANEYEQLAGKTATKKVAGRSFKDFLLNGPSLKGLDLERDQSPMRDVDL